MEPRCRGVEPRIFACSSRSWGCWQPPNVAFLHSAGEEGAAAWINGGPIVQKRLQYWRQDLPRDRIWRSQRRCDHLGKCRRACLGCHADRVQDPGCALKLFAHRQARSAIVIRLRTSGVTRRLGRALLLHPSKIGYLHQAFLAGEREGLISALSLSDTEYPMRARIVQ